MNVSADCWKLYSHKNDLKLLAYLCWAVRIFLMANYWMIDFFSKEELTADCTQPFYPPTLYNFISCPPANHQG